MTDKYEEFKKWFIESDWVNCEVIIKKLPTNGGNAHLIYPNKKSIFENFEKEQSEKEKEKQVKGIIKEVFNTVPLNEYEVEDEWCRKTIYVPNDIITEIYDKLKEKDLIK